MSTRLSLSVMRGARQVANMTDLRALNGVRGESIMLVGYATAGDGGQGLFYWDHESASGDNGGTIVVPSNARGRWRRVFDGPIHAAWFGAKGDGVTNSGPALQAAFDEGIATGNYSFVWPDGVLCVSPMLEIGARDDDPEDVINGVRITGTSSSLEETNTILKWIGATGGTIMRIRNASGTVLDGIAFNGSGTAAHCLQITHVEGDDGICSNVVLRNGFVVDARDHNILVGNLEDSYGDCSALVFDNFFGHASSGTVPTQSHLCVNAQYTFGITMLGTRLGSSPSSGYPSAHIRMRGGSLVMLGGALDIASDASIVLEGHPEDPLAVFAGLTIDSVEVQSANMLLRTDYAGFVAEHEGDTIGAPLRTVALRNVLHNDILGAVSATSIYWDVPKFATLSLDDGCRLQGNVEIAHADARVNANGPSFYEGKGFTGVGVGGVSGRWLVASGIVSNWHTRLPHLATYADDAAAGSGGLTAGDIYKTSAGVVMVKL